MTTDGAVAPPSSVEPTYMNSNPLWLAFLIATLATWRLAHLVAHEDGPFDAIVRLRSRAGDSAWGRLMDCPYCLSLWFALPGAVWLQLAYGSTWMDAAEFWLALSGAACVIEKLTYGAGLGASHREER